MYMIYVGVLHDLLGLKERLNYFEAVMLLILAWIRTRQKMQESR